jgi:hypothetical protein
MRLNDLFEARKPAPPAPVDYAAVLERLKSVAGKLVRRPFDVDWDYRYGRNLKAKVEASKTEHVAGHDPEYDGELVPLQDRDLYIEYLPDAWRDLTMRTFDAVRRQIEHDILAYQKRHGERLDRQSGHASDMNFIEDSDWLRAMQLQKNAAMSIAYANADVAAIAALIESFVADWSEAAYTDQRDEPTLTEGMFEGLAAAVPLLMLVAKKSA